LKPNKSGYTSVLGPYEPLDDYAGILKILIYDDEDRLVRNYAKRLRRSVELVRKDGVSVVPVHAPFYAFW
jgi:hypothetical protein